MRGHDDHRQVGQVFVHAGQQLQAVHAGHADVGHQHVGAFAGQRIEQLAGAREGPYRDAGAAQGAFQHPSDRVLVVDDPDAQRLVHGSNSSGR